MATAEQILNDDMQDDLDLSWPDVMGAPPATVTPIRPAPVMMNPAFEFSFKNIAPVVAAVGGAVVGYKVWKKHPILGGIAGLTAAGGATKLALGPDRKYGALGIGVAAAAVLGSKAWKKHPVGGFVLSDVAASLVGGYAVSKLVK